MEQQVLLVAGLPGCGKTTYLQRLAQDGWVVFDDFKADARNDSSCFRDSRHYESLIDALSTCRACAVADIDFCRAEPRVEAERALRQDVPNLELEWRFFENDPLRCEANTRRRDRPSLERDLQKLQEYAAVYAPPIGAPTLPVWPGR